jgi:tetratricopeptide (TPR) repeat protein
MNQVRPTGSALLLAFTLFFAAALSALAQNDGRLSGQILDFDGKPWPGVAVTITNTETGQSYKTATDKDGEYNQLGLHAGVYILNFTGPDKPPYQFKYQVQLGQDNIADVSFKNLQSQGLLAAADEKAKAASADDAFKNMKTHFSAGIAAMQVVTDLRTKLASTPADQKSSIQDQVKASCTTAVTEFEAAEPGVGPKDTKNHATILYDLGVAYECLGRNADADAAFQKCTDVEPSTGCYRGYATNLAKAAVATPDTKNPDAQMDDVFAKAGAACDKAAALESTAAAAVPVADAPAPAAAPGSQAAVCWRNIGAVFTNASRMKHAAAAYQKATELDPKNPDNWFLLGNTLLADIDTKTEGGKIIYIPKPGTKEAYQKYLELAPNGPHAGEAKDTLAYLATLEGGEATTISSKKKK